MRRVSLIVVAAVLMASAGWAQNGAGKISIYANTGMTLPVYPGGLTDYWNSGLNFGGGVGYDMSKYVAIQGYFNYNTFGFKEDYFFEKYGIENYSPSSDGGGVKVITAVINVKASFIGRGNKVIPYFIGGLGFLRESPDDLTYSYTIGNSNFSYTSSAGDPKSTLGSVIGFGVDVMVMENAGVFAEIAGGVGAVELKIGLSGADDGVLAYAPFKIGAFFQLP